MKMTRKILVMKKISICDEKYKRNICDKKDKRNLGE